LSKRQQWWREGLEGASLAHEISSVLQAMRKQGEARLDLYEMADRLFGNPSPFVSHDSLARYVSTHPAARANFNCLNAIEVAADTVLSKIRVNRPRPMFLTDGGSWTEQRAAKKLTSFSDGLLHEAHVHEDVGPACVMDAIQYGDGFAHVFRGPDDRVHVERVHPSELWVDELEAIHGRPRQMHRIKPVDRGQLLDEFGDDSGAVRAIELASSLPAITTMGDVSDMLEVRESWHLPSGPEAKDGRHVISVAGAALVDEPYTKPRFPFSRIRWARRSMGFWSKSAFEQTRAIQLDLAQTSFSISKAIRLCSGPQTWVESSTNVSEGALSNELGIVRKYTGQPPVFASAPIMQPEVYQREADLAQRIFQTIGASELAAKGEKPVGLNSGQALRTYKDEADGRLVTLSQDYEQFTIDLTDIGVDTVRDIVADGETGYEAKTPNSRFLVSVDFKEIDLDASSYIIKCFPTSSLPKDPAGRLVTIEEHVKAGFLSPRQAKRLLDFPDLEALTSLQSSSEDWLTHVLDKIADEGEMTPCDTTDDLALAEELCLEYIARGKLQKLEEERLDLLRTFLAQVRDLQQQAAEQMAPPSGAPGIPPAAPLGPPPGPQMPAPMPAPMPGVMP
jgi:hypothetical protein